MAFMRCISIAVVHRERPNRRPEHDLLCCLIKILHYPIILPFLLGGTTQNLRGCPSGYLVAAGPVVWTIGLEVMSSRLRTLTWDDTVTNIIGTWQSACHQHSLRGMQTYRLAWILHHVNRWMRLMSHWIIQGRWKSTSRITANTYGCTVDLMNAVMWELFCSF